MVDSAKSEQWPLLFNDNYKIRNKYVSGEKLDSDSKCCDSCGLMYRILVLSLLGLATISSIAAMAFSIFNYKHSIVAEPSITVDDGIDTNLRLTENFARNKQTFASKAAQPFEKPNIFLFLVDDMGYGDLASFGQPTQEWGAIDDLSKKSMVFTQFYADPLCTPTRAQLLTGRMAVRSGLSGGYRRVFQPTDSGGLPANEIAIPELLKSAGYVSGFNGKWHLGINCEQYNDGCHLPFNHGFDFVGTYFPLSNNDQCGEEQKYSSAPNPLKCFLYRGRGVTPWQQPVYHQTLTQTFVDEAKQFIAKNRQNSWFYYFATPQIHTTLYSSKKFKASSKRVGEIVKHLDYLNLTKKTLFMFLSDNGASMKDCEEGGNNGLLRAGKSTTWEGGIRVPAMAYWPERIKPGVSHAVHRVADIFTTVASLAHLPVPIDREIDGIDMSPVLFSDGSQSEENFNRPLFFYCSDKLMAIRQGAYKLHYWTWVKAHDEDLKIRQYDSVEPVNNAPKPRKSSSIFRAVVLFLLGVIAICSVIAMTFSILAYKTSSNKEPSDPPAAVESDGIRANIQLTQYLAGKKPLALQKNTRPVEKPNIFIFLVDDLGFGDLASYGHPTQERGPVDELSRQSMRFTQFYTDTLCTPTRATLLTGRIAIRYGLSGGADRVLLPNDAGGLPDEEITIPELLKSKGYTSGMNGKWHLGINCKTNTDGCHLPFNHGFDFVGTYYPFTNNLACDEENRYAPGPNPLICFLYRGKATTPWQQPVYHENLTLTLVNEAKEFLTKNRKNPWFYYFATPQIHKNLYRSERFKGSSKRGQIGDTINELEWSVGEVLKHLHNLKLAENTLFLFLSDNGATKEDCEEGGSNGLLAAGKGMTWDGGMRVPAMAYWPGRIRPGVSHAVLSVADIFTTVARLADVSIPADREIDGIDMSPVLFGDGSQSEEKFNRPLFFYCSDKLMAIRLGAYKLHYWTWLWTLEQATKKCINGLTPYSNKFLGPSHFYWWFCNETRMEEHNPPLLYDLEQDPSEMYPLRAQDYQWVINKARAAYQKHSATLDLTKIVNQMRLKQHFHLSPCCYEKGRKLCVCNYPLSDKFGF